MKNPKLVMMVVALVMMAGTACALTWLRANQRLGTPGIRATPIAGQIKMDIALPEHVLDFTSTNVPEPAVAVGYFPQDTSYAERRYFGPSGIAIQSTAILMGADRTSIHRPEYCIPGQGWTIDDKKIINIPINDNPPYQLETARWDLSQVIKQPNGQLVKYTAVYVFWYVANNEQTADHNKMLEWMTLDLFRTGALQRWAYMSYFALCPPGQEDAAFEQMERLIAAQVPQFELPLKQK